MIDPTISAHAASRYVVRVKPWLTHEQAREELHALAVMHGRIQDVPPGWTDPAADDPADISWLLIGDDICLPLVAERHALTVLIRGGLRPGARRYLTDAKRRRRDARRARSRDSGSKPQRREAKANPSQRRQRERRELDLPD